MRARHGAMALCHRPVKDRIDHELAIIRQKRFAHYFLVVEEIVQGRASDMRQRIRGRLDRVLLFGDHPCGSSEASPVFRAILESGPP